MGIAPRTKETLPDFLKWRRVTRPPLVFRGLTGSQRTPGFGASQVLYYKDRVCVPDDNDLRKAILEEAHSGPFAIHPGSTKMYQDLKMSFWWSGMKKEISEFVTKCLVCQRVKAEHQVPLGLLQSIIIPEWKWDQITMDFVVGLPLTRRKHDSVWVVVD